MARGSTLVILASSIATLFILGVYGVLAAQGWPGAPSECQLGAGCWCEQPNHGWIREPWNTWSNLPIFALAIALAVLGRRQAKLLPDSSLHSLPILFAFSYGLWMQAAGALFFHGSLTVWSRALDGGSVLAVWGVVLSTSFLRMGRLSRSRLWLPIVLSTVAALAYRWFLSKELNLPGLLCLLSTLSLELILFRRTRDRKRLGPPWLALSLTSLLIALFFWGISRQGGPLCNVFPSHALWHIFAGFAVTAFGLHASRDHALSLRSS